MIVVKADITGTQLYRAEPCPIIASVELSLKIQYLVRCIRRIGFFKLHGFGIKVSISCNKLIFYIIDLIILICQWYSVGRNCNFLHMRSNIVIEIYLFIDKRIVYRLLTVLCRILGIRILGKRIKVRIDNGVYAVFDIARNTVPLSGNELCQLIIGYVPCSVLEFFAPCRVTVFPGIISVCGDNKLGLVIFEKCIRTDRGCLFGFISRSQFNLTGISLLVLFGGIA